MIKFTKVMVAVNVLIVVHMITGCEDRNIADQKEIDSRGVVKLEGCEYLVSSNGHPGGSIFSHKGNCQNPIHNYARKEDEDEQDVKKNREERRK